MNKNKKNSVSPLSDDEDDKKKMNSQNPQPGAQPQNPQPGTQPASQTQNPQPGAQQGAQPQNPQPGAQQGAQSVAKPGTQPASQTQNPQPGTQPASQPQNPQPGTQQGAQSSGQPQGAQSVAKPASQPQNPQSGAPQPADPPVNIQVAAIPGIPSAYAQLAWGQKRPIPAPPSQFNQPPDSIPNSSKGALAIDEDKAKKALINFAESKFCYGKKPAHEAKITSIVPSTVVHYSLETFTQKRSINYTFTPYSGEPLDSYQAGPIPDPWSIKCDSNGEFLASDRTLKVPHTEQLMNCYHCKGIGNIRCTECLSYGRVKCKECGGRGHTIVENEEKHCHTCLGTGKVRCQLCGGGGNIQCTVCKGKTKLKCFIELNVSFTNHKNDYVQEKIPIPDHLIKTVSGEPILNQTAQLLNPIKNFENQSVITNSANIFNLHRGYFNFEYPIMQRQILRLVPIFEINYQWNEYTSDYFIYGSEMKVHCEKYPQTCCGCCCCCGGKCTII